MHNTKQSPIFISIILLLILILFTPSAYGGELVNPTKIYQSKSFYSTVEKTLEALHQQYPKATQLEVIGQSVNGRNLTALKLGNGPREIFINGAHHGREYMTTVLILDQIELLASAYEQNQSLQGVNVRHLLDQVSIWFVPLVNPDGVELVTSGPSAINNQDKLYSIVSPGFNFKTWKANGRGVDLNSNYPTTPYSKNKLTKPSSANYPGPKPFSEPETKSLRDFTLSHDFESVIAYHSSGEIIYWYFGQTGQLEQRSHAFGKVLSQTTGYPLIGKSQSMGGRGYKDWFIQQFNRPGYTIEIGKYSNGLPLATNQYPEIWKDNKFVPLLAAKEVTKQYPSTSFSATPWKLTLQTEDPSPKELHLFNQQGTHVVPLRELCNELSIQLMRDSKTNTVTCSNNTTTLRLSLDSTKAVVNGEAISSIAPTTLFKGTTYVDVRFFLTAFGYPVQLDIEENLFKTELNQQ